MIYDEPRVARTGVTVIVPREDQIWRDYAFAADYSFNGNGEMTGLPWQAGSAVMTANQPLVGLINLAYPDTGKDLTMTYNAPNR